MTNKDNTVPAENKKAFTPKLINEALESLPSNYVNQTLIILDKWKDSGLIENTFSRVYISRVKTGLNGAFNEDIMNALVEVGMNNKKVQEKFGRKTKKTS
ncbi:hypothetical protein H8R23_05140 [Flavobacterium sp. F-380]|uniref:DnaD domain-containing protein n=1 Tax=Flavobacterium kayseriense TaxID=2764714 RepID=A0ABR7J5G7_9FLAO|nr:hypothetical protein [Flavobacterium kayseriense]MBC5840783.1 hypothetical protein [Flavobacterium kayseriense]MBC5846547.1 hypothetical protein [Flavobacterium kayseriense]